MIRRDPAEVLAWISEFPSSPTTERHRQLRGDAIHALREAIKACPSDGVSLLAHTTRGGSPEHREMERPIAEAILTGWREADSDVLPHTEIAEALAGAWTAGLTNWGEASEPERAGRDWLNLAFNHWAGLIAMVALNAVIHERREAGGRWEGLSDDFKALFEEMLEEDSHSARFAREFLAARIDLLHQLDDGWCAQNILPLLDPTIDPDRAVRCWEAYLAIGRISAELLDAGLIEHYISMAGHLDRLESRRAAGAFCDHWAAIAFGSGPDGQDWLKQFTNKANAGDRVRWMHAVRRRLSDLDGSKPTANWDFWMRPYWENRLRSIPKRLTDEEGAALAGWTPHLDTRFPDGVELACKDAALGFLDGSNGLMSDGALLVAELDGRGVQEDQSGAMACKYPEATSQLLTHMMSNTEKITDQSLRHGLWELVPKLLERVGPEQAGLLREQAERLNVGGNG